MRNRIGIDMGAAYTVVSAPGEGILTREASLVALSEADGSLLGIGSDAEEIVHLEDTATRKYPLREGGLLSEYTKAILARSLSRAVSEEGARIFLSVPCEMSENEENTLCELAIQAGAGEAYSVYSPIAALVGAGIDLAGSAMVLDIGAKHTDILTLCHGRIQYKKTYSIGGDDFDRSIAGYMKQHHRVLIGRETAEVVKQKLGTVWVGEEKRYLDVRGIDEGSGEPCIVRLCSEEMFQALEEPMSNLIAGICEAVTKIHTDSVQDVFDTGILLAGGAVLLDGLDKMVSGVTGIATTLLPDAEGVVARGLAILLETVSEPKKAGTSNISRYCMKTATLP